MRYPRKELMGHPGYDPDYPKLIKIQVHPDSSTHFWIVTLTTGRYTVAFGTLRGWLNLYAR